MVEGLPDALSGTATCKDPGFMEGAAFQPWSSLPPLPSLLTKTLVSTRYPSNHHSQGGNVGAEPDLGLPKCPVNTGHPDPQSGQASDPPWPGEPPRACVLGRADSPGSICPWFHSGVDNT